jgi:hypothetical protein
MPDPSGRKVWKIIDEDGTRMIGVAVRTPIRQQPSAPRLLPYAGKDA